MFEGKKFSKGFSQFSGVFAIVTAISVLIGWVFDIAVLRSVSSHFAAMKPNAAICFLLLGFSILAIQEPGEQSNKRNRFATLAPWGICAIAGATLCEYIFQIDLGIDRPLLLGRHDTVGSAIPGRMAVNAAISFLLLALGAAYIDLKPRKLFAFSEICALLTLVLITPSLFGYLYDSTKLFGVFSPNQIAINAVAVFMVSSLGILASRPNRGVMAEITSEALGSLSFRRLTPFAIFAFPLFGWLRLQGERAGLYDFSTGLGIMVFFSVAFSVALLWKNARHINILDKERHLSEVAVKRAESEGKEQQRVLEELKLARELALAAASAKAQFLAHMSHEIRTPLNGLIGMTDLLMETGLNDEQKKYVQTVTNCGETLLDIVNDVLDFSKIEAGKLEIEKVEYSPKKLLEERIDMVAARARAKGIGISCFISPRVPEVVIGDPSRIGQVLLNLVGNAIKFTEHGSVTCQVQLVHETTDQLSLCFEVSDTGIGLDESQKEKLFQSFTQADASMSRRFGGTGLGLSICKKIIDAMGGEIGAKGKVGSGSTFWFTIPQERKDTAPLAKKRYFPGVSIYIITEDKNLERTTEKYCTEWGLMVASCSPDIEAIKSKVNESAGARGEHNIIFIDAATDKLKNLAATVCELVSKRTLSCLIATEKEISHSNFVFPKKDGVIVMSKPFHQSQFFNGVIMLSGIDKFEDESTHLEPEPAAKSLVQKKILVAEDNVINQQLIQRHLEILGYHVRVVADGAQTLAELQSNAYDLVLMDCQMPVMDGYAATIEIRRREKQLGKHTLVVALTANATAEDRQACINAGMDDILTKPIKRDRLATMLTKWLGTEEVKGVG